MTAWFSSKLEIEETSEGGIRLLPNEKKKKNADSTQKSPLHYLFEEEENELRKNDAVARRSRRHQCFLPQQRKHSNKHQLLQQ